MPDTNPSKTKSTNTDESLKRKSCQSKFYAQNMSKRLFKTNTELFFFK